MTHTKVWELCLPDCRNAGPEERAMLLWGASTLAQWAWVTALCWLWWVRLSGLHWCWDLSAPSGRRRAEGQTAPLSSSLPGLWHWQLHSAASRLISMLLENWQQSKIRLPKSKTWQPVTLLFRWFCREDTGGEGKGAESAPSFQTCNEHQAQKACKTPIIPAPGACSLWII